MELFLVLPASDDYTGPTERLHGHKWRIEGPVDVSSSDNTPVYHCVSYTWGSDRTPNMFEIGDIVSAQTKGALEAAMRCMPNLLQQAFWIDAVCVPRSGPARRSTLESMGFIYSTAKSVIVVLQKDAWHAVNGVDLPKVPLDEVRMRAVDADPWISSVWTYQELVNANALRFTGFGAGVDSSLEGEVFLNGIGFSLDTYKRSNNVSALGMRTIFPNLDAMEDAVADWRIAGYLERSMLTCLTGVAGRSCDPERPTNRLYSLLGAMSDAASRGAVNENIPALTEKAMQLCATKGDFSYISPQR